MCECVYNKNQWEKGYNLKEREEGYMVRFGGRKGKRGDKTIISKINKIIKNYYLCS